MYATEGSSEFTQVATAFGFPDPMRIQLHIGQSGWDGKPRITQALDLSYDNLIVEAEAIVPEPSTIVLLMMGAVGFLAYAWRRRRGA